jgi:hypothetical protein
MNNQSFCGILTNSELGQALVFAFLSNERVYFAYFTSIEYAKTPVLRFLLVFPPLQRPPPGSCRFFRLSRTDLFFFTQPHLSSRYNPAKFSPVNILFTVLAVIFA